MLKREAHRLSLFSLAAILMASVLLHPLFLELHESSEHSCDLDHGHSHAVQVDEGAQGSKTTDSHSSDEHTDCYHCVLCHAVAHLGLTSEAPVGESVTECTEPVASEPAAVLLALSLTSSAPRAPPRTS